jgi:hypothetical protein
LSVLTTNQKGAIAEAAIAKVAVNQGILVSRPLYDAPYDLVFDGGRELLRVQCKWVMRHQDVVIVRCQRARRGPGGFVHRCYVSDEIDVIAAYCAELDACYLLPPALWDGRMSVQLRVAAARNNQHRGVHWARDFEFKS